MRGYVTLFGRLMLCIQSYGKMRKEGEVVEELPTRRKKKKEKGKRRLLG